MRPLKLAPTINTAKLVDYSLNSEVLKRIIDREKANIVEGYTLTSEVGNDAIYKFFAEINIDNDKLWSLVKYFVSGFHSEVALIYHHIDEEPRYGCYVDKYSLINELEKYKLELSQDGFLKFGIIYHQEDENGKLLEEVFVEKTKYIRYWGMDKSLFIDIMEKFDLYPVDGLNFIDEYPLQTEALSLHYSSFTETTKLIDIFDELYKK